MCVKYGVCAPIAGLTTTGSLDLAADQVHVYAGGDPVFLPALKKIFRCINISSINILQLKYNNYYFKCAA